MPIKYNHPNTAALVNLKTSLSLSNPEMADLFGMTPENWRKYTGGASPRPVSMQMLFFAAARLELSPEEFERVLARMRAIGATIDLGSGEPS